MTCTYLDSNGTTLMPPRVTETLIKWVNRGNMSSTYPSAKSASELVEKFKSEIAEKCQFPQEGKDGYTIILTSGGSEANSTIIQSAIRSFIKGTSKRPHIIVSSMEHDNIMMLMEDLSEEDVDVTYIDPITKGDYIGSIDSKEVEKQIRPNTCMISIMSANNETGIKNDVKTIGNIAKRHNMIPFHTDAVQMFGKYSINPIENNITSFSGSFHKLYGPTGVGVLVVKNAFLKGWGLKPMIQGHQNGTLRGGTECIHNIAAAREAYKLSFENRDTKNHRLLKLKKYTIDILSRHISTLFIEEYDDRYNKTGIVFIHPKYNWNNVLPNTLLMSIIQPNICNVKIRKELLKQNVIISVGSTCKTNDKKASHVLTAIALPLELKKGIIRISTNDFTTEDDINLFIYHLLTLIKNRTCTTT